MFRTSRFLAFTVAAAICLTQIAKGGSESVNEQFLHLRNIIEANGADSLGASRTDFVKAVTALEDLIAGGFTDTEATKLLAHSYRVWALVYTDDENSAESKELLRKEEAIYAELVEKNPDDAKLWLSYALSLDDPAKSLDALKRAESLAPEDAHVQSSLGKLYAYGLGDPEKGVAHLERAVELEQGHARLRYGEQLARVLELTGDNTRAAQVRGDMKAFEQALIDHDRPTRAEEEP